MMNEISIFFLFKFSVYAPLSQATATNLYIGLRGLETVELSGTAQMYQESFEIKKITERLQLFASSKYLG